MLAQNFKTPADLEITDAEFNALVKVLGMLEREELAHTRDFRGDGFNMNCSGLETDCGTVACIGGWTAKVMGRSMPHYVGYQHSCSLTPVFWGHGGGDVTPDRAAIALRNYLTHGEPRWEEALSD